ncbi:MerR family transcriptional regulator [Eggerthellaceae bacterium zg-887]|uniref:MerR family transcriptional regulator n=1 Tax=Xiamenia xianingshaonis TaxID=2682776 RepID=UPI00140AEA1B|nr:MerR family transcriptional regulator [Xiamenia xianingshaonis]NHM16711.1 MerR family transcriptional regulator [Xiamenia xianingshaonis]
MAHGKPHEPQTYTVGELAALAGVTVRTLHHYEDTGLLKPQRTTANYRVYGPCDVERLQQIMLFRACGMKLSAIKRTLADPAFDAQRALEEQLAELRRQQTNLTTLIGTVETTLADLKGETVMTDKQRFEGMKRKAVEDNERAYGAEARKRWGNAAVDGANEKLLAMDEREWSDVEELERAIIKQLRTAMETGDAAGPEAQKLVSMHARWLQMHWADGTYAPAAHVALAEGYVADPRFTAYYDEAAGTGAAVFLRDAIVGQLG